MNGDDASSDQLGGGEVRPRGLVLVVDGDAQRAEALCRLLRENSGYEPVHVPAVVGALREVTSRVFDLIVTDTTVQRGGDGLKLVRLILLEGAVAKAPPVLVVTAETDPTVVQQCMRAGVVDYVLYPCDPAVLAQRIRQAAEQLQSLSDRLVRVATPYLGPAARVFFQQVVRTRFPGVAFDRLGPDHLPDLFRCVRAIGLKVVGTRAEELVRQLEATFPTTRSTPRPA